MKTSILSILSLIFFTSFLTNSQISWNSPRKINLISNEYYFIYVVSGSKKSYSEEKMNAYVLNNDEVIDLLNKKYKPIRFPVNYNGFIPVNRMIAEYSTARPLFHYKVTDITFNSIATELSYLQKKDLRKIIEKEFLNWDNFRVALEKIIGSAILIKYQKKIKQSSKTQVSSIHRLLEYFCGRGYFNTHSYKTPCIILANRNRTKVLPGFTHKETLIKELTLFRLNPLKNE